jgi:hypothetical protein
VTDPQHPYQGFPDEQPPVVPTGGYQVPTTGADPSGFGGPPVADPLTPGPYPTFDGWVRRVARTVGRAFGPGLAILALCTLVPALLTGGVTLWFQQTRLTAQVTPGQQLTSAQLTQLLGELGGYIGITLLASGIAAVATSIGWVAVLRLMVDQAAGRPASIGAALRYGVRRGPLLWGWYLLAELVVMVGLCACFVPGVYLALALSLIAPIVAFERGEPAFTRSFRLVHSNFWPTVGRLLLLGLAVAVVTYLVPCVFGAATGIGGGLSAPSHQPGTLALAVDVLLSALVALPIALVEIAGVLVTYAELRGRQEPLTSADLAEAAA